MDGRVAKEPKEENYPDTRLSQPMNQNRRSYLVFRK